MPVSHKAKLPRDVPESLPVYRLAGPKVSPATVAALATRIGLTGKGKEFHLSPDWIRYHEDQVEVAQSVASGAIAVRDLERYAVDAEAGFDLSDRRAVEASQAFLARTKIVDPKALTMRKVTHLRSAGMDLKTGAKVERTVDAGVVYTRTVDGIPVTGPGGFVMVNLDAQAQVTGMTAVTRPLGAEAGKVEILPPSAAVEALEAHADKERWNATVLKAEFAYFEQGAGDAQKFLQPAYAFVLAVAGDETVRKTAFVLPAGSKSYEPLERKKRFAPSRAPARKDTDAPAPARARPIG